MMDFSTSSRLQNIAYRTTLKDALLAKISNYETQLKDAKEALAFLEQHPELERFFTILPNIINY